MDQIISRTNIYGLLSRLLLQEVDEKLLEILQNDPVILDFLPNWSKWKLRNDVDADLLLNQYINPDFTNLTLLHLTPYETFYTREDQMIETGGANPVTDMYSMFDYLVDFEVARVVSSDHIGIELEFMHNLCLAEQKALSEGDNDGVSELHSIQYDFLNKHLLQWVPFYLINMKYEARTPLYADLAEMALEFVLSDNEYLTSLKS